MKKLTLEELNRLTIDQFKASPKNPIVIVLDNIRSAYNVGSFFRTADAFACEEVVITGISARPPHPGINKTAIGADRSITWTYQDSVLNAIFGLKEKGYKLIGVEQTDQSITLDSLELQLAEKVALIFGNEVDGISEEVLNELDIMVEIPQYGTKHSLNVSVCGGVVIYNVMQRITKT